MAEPHFVHLRVHSDYSMVDGLTKTAPLVKQAAAMGMAALAITDFTNLCGLVKFYEVAYRQGLKPIIGADFQVHCASIGDEPTQLTLLAANNVGYQNLTMLISKAWLRGYGTTGPCLDRDWLIEHRQGLIALSGGRRGDIGVSLLRGNRQLAMQSLAFYQQYFPNHYYIELTRTGRAEEESYLHAAIQLAEEADLAVVATNEVCFIQPQDFDAHEIRVAIRGGYTLDDARRTTHYSAQQYLRSEQEMCALFADIPEALTNSVEIAKRCNVDLRLGEYFLPAFPTGEMSAEDFLVMKSQQGLEARLIQLFPEQSQRVERRGAYDARLATELEVINQMGFPGYFLIVMEFIQWSKDNDIPVGPGRGSGAGSLVAYALNITDIDPLQFDLLFERFLNPERVSMPDFDIDFCMDKRDRVIEHVAEMYGRDAVSQIITFGTMAAKAVIRDVGRVLGHPYGFVDRIAKLIPTDPGMTLEKAFELEPQLTALYQDDEEVKALIDMARKLEGVTRNAGKHAGGVVIAPTKITDFSPLYCDESGSNPVTQFDKNDVEYVGLVKFDFLGLRTLTIIHRALTMVNARRVAQQAAPITISTIPLNDKKSFAMLQRAETTAVFQLESRGMKDLIRRLQPDCFEDMIALVALFRPGPLQSGMVDNFIDRKHLKEAISYPDSQWQHACLKSVLEPTYGIILYQEQVMQIAQELAGYTLGEADLLRRAMGKKKPEEMARQRSVFQQGAEKRGIKGELAMKIFDLVEKFAGYGFNKSHSAAYALVSYQTLWLKTHFTAEFMAAVLSADMDNTEKVVSLYEECKKLKLMVLPPDINSGDYYFNVNDHGAIVYGIGAIKGVGEGPISAMIQARQRGGPFRDLLDLCTRVDSVKLNRRVMEKLIMAGALDQLGPHRAALMHALTDALKTAEQHAKAASSGQADMFGVMAHTTTEVQHTGAQVAPWSEEVLLEAERETLGLYLSGHPISRYLPEIKRYPGVQTPSELHSPGKNKTFMVAGLVVALRIAFTKRGKRICLFTLEDNAGRIEVMLFADALEKHQSRLQKHQIIIVSGQVSVDGFSDGFKMTAREVMTIDEAREKYARSLAISLTAEQIDDNLLSNLRQLLEPHRAGTMPINLYYQRVDARAKLRLGVAWCVTPCDSLLRGLRALLGMAQVELEFD